MMLLGLGNKKQDPDAVTAPHDIQLAVEKALDERKAVTPELGGKGSTSGMGDAICDALG